MRRTDPAGLASPRAEGDRPAVRAGRRTPPRRDRPRRTGARFVAAAAFAAALVASAAGASAQEPLAFELRGGFGLPAFDLADVADAGPAVGLDLSYRIAERLSLVAGGDLALLDGERTEAGDAPDLNVWHYGAGLEAQILEPRRTYWRLSLGAGMGGTTLDASRRGGSESHLSAYGSLELGRSVTPELDLFVGVKSWLAFAGGDGAVAGPSGGDVLWSFPLTAGVRLHF